jgi:membrane protein implicated in regulation of membrane protease activity
VPAWLRNSLFIAAVVGGALLLWVGLALLVAILVVAAIPFWIWSRFARRRAPVGPVTLEGTATRVDESVVLTPPASDEKARVGAPEKN